MGLRVSANAHRRWFAAAVCLYAHSCYCGVLLGYTVAAVAYWAALDLLLHAGCSGCGLLRLRSVASAICGFQRAAAATRRYARTSPGLSRSFSGLRSASGHPAKSSSCVAGKLSKRLADVGCIGGGTSPDKASFCSFLFPLTQVASC